MSNETQHHPITLREAHEIAAKQRAEISSNRFPHDGSIEYSAYAPDGFVWKDNGAKHLIELCYPKCGESARDSLSQLIERMQMGLDPDEQT
jgi:streptogramin lyase